MILRSSLLRILYYYNKGKEIPVLYTNLQLNSYPNTQLDLFCSDNLSFQCTAHSTWLINQCTDPNTWLTTKLRKMLAAKFFSSSTWWRSRSSLVTKPYGVQTPQLLEKKDKLGQIISSHNMLIKNLCIKLHSLASAMTALKIIFIYFSDCKKRKPKHAYTNWSKIISEKLIFLNHNR